MKAPLVAGHAELLGEATLSASVDYLLDSQHPDGSWGDLNEPDPHKRYHTVWTAVDALRIYEWQEREEWPEAVQRWFTGTVDGVPG